MLSKKKPESCSGISGHPTPKTLRLARYDDGTIQRLNLAADQNTRRGHAFWRDDPPGRPMFGAPVS